MKQKLSLFLAIIMILTLAVPSGLTALAATVTAVEEEVTSKIIKTSLYSNNYDGSFYETPLEYILDRNNDTKYSGRPLPFPAAYDPFAISWEMSEATAVQTLVLSAPNDIQSYGGRFPMSWSFCGSNDRTSWNRLDYRSEQLGATNRGQFYYSFANTTAYKYYQIEIYGTRDNDILSFSELQLSAKLFDSYVAPPLRTPEQFDEELSSYLSSFSYSGESMKKTLVQGFRREFGTLPFFVQNELEKLPLLEKAERAIHQYETKTTLDAMIDEIGADITKMQGKYDYHINEKITRAFLLYNSLSSADKSLITSYEDLINARSMIDALVNNSFNVYAAGWDAPFWADLTPWISECDTAQQTLSQTAVADELKYQRARQGYMLENYENLTVNLTAEWGYMMMAQCDGESLSNPNDNVGNPWGHAGRHWSYVGVPFAGTAFSSTGYFALQDTKPAISDTFYMNGNVYAQYFDRYRTYKYQPISRTVAAPEIITVFNFPGNGGNGDITNNSFRYAYAKYNQDNKWNDEYVGVPSGTVKNSGMTVYQAFVSNTGTKYIAGATGAVSALNYNAINTKQVAFVIDSATAAAITALGSGDFEAGLLLTGAPLSSTVAGVQMFVNKKVVRSGDSVTLTDLEKWEGVKNAIDTIPNPLTKEIYYTDPMAGTVNTAFTAALDNLQAAYNDLSQDDKGKVANYARLADIKKQIERVISDRAVGIAIRNRIAALPAEITLANEAEIKSIYSTFSDISYEQAQYIDNINAFSTAYYALKPLLQISLTEMIEALVSVYELQTLLAAGDSSELTAAILAIDVAVTAYDDNYEMFWDFSIDPAMSTKLRALGALIPQIRGDLDGDRKVDVSDVVMLRNWIMAGKPDAAKLGKGDLDGDGKIDVSDIVKLRNIIMGIK